LGEGDRRGIEAARTDLRIWRRETGGRIVNGTGDTPRLASGAVERAEVAGERGRSGDKSVARGGVLANIRLLKTSEEEQLVPDDLTSERAAELVPLQAVLPGGEIIYRIDISVADELEKVAVP